MGAHADRSRTPPRGWRLARVAGVPIRLRGSGLATLAVLGLLLHGQVSAGPTWHPGWVAPLVTATTCLAFLLSVVGHELAHALVARGLGLPVVAVTVLHLGGVTELGREPDDPRDQALIAAAGPLCNLLLAGALVAAGTALGPRTVAGGTLALVGSLNAAIGVLNLLPGHPLDGGAMVRAAVWSLTGDAARALALSGALGQGVGAAMAVGGVVGMLPGGPGGGDPAWLWLALAGAFVAVAARLGVLHADVRTRLLGLTARDLAHAVPFALSAAAGVDVVAARVRETTVHGLVVDERGRPLGTFGPEDLAAVPAGTGTTTTVADHMRPLAGTVEADTELIAVLPRFRRTRDSVLAVLADGRAVATLRASDVLGHLERT